MLLSGKEVFEFFCENEPLPPIADFLDIFVTIYPEYGQCVDVNDTGSPKSVKFYRRLFRNCEKSKIPRIAKESTSNANARLQQQIMDLKKENKDLKKQKYARYGAIYKNTLENLESTQPGCTEFLSEKGLSVQGQDRYNCRIAIDQRGEQTIKKDAKVSGGIKYFASDKNTILKWMLNRLVQAKNTNALMTLANVKSSDEGYKSNRPSQILKSEKFVNGIINVMTDEFINPFDELLQKDYLYKLSSGIKVEADAANEISQVKRKGNAQHNDFVTNRIKSTTVPIHDPIKRNKLLSFKNASKKILSKGNEDSFAATSNAATTLHVKKMNNELCVNTAKGCSTIEEVPAYEEPLPEINDIHSLTSITTSAEIMGVICINNYISFYICSRRVTLRDSTGYCQSCKMSVKTSSTSVKYIYIYTFNNPALLAPFLLCSIKDVTRGAECLNFVGELYRTKLTGTKNKKSIIDIGPVPEEAHNVLNQTGSDKKSYLEAVLGYHCFTGRNSINCFSGKGMIKPLAFLDQRPEYIECFSELEAIRCWKKHLLTNKSATENAEEHGWCLINGKLDILWMTCNPAPEETMSRKLHMRRKWFPMY
eukprot:gene2140-2429_t